MALVVSDSRGEPPAEDREERRARLAGHVLATLQLSVTGDDEGEIVAELPCEWAVEHPLHGLPADVPGEPRPVGRATPRPWLVVRAEALDPLPLGSTTLAAISVAVPDYAGPGHYRLDDLHSRARRDEVEWWEVCEFHLSPRLTADEDTWYLDLDGAPTSYVETTDCSVTFDLPMASIVSSIHVSGTITWAR
jgi:hypothetical protein